MLGSNPAGVIFPYRLCAVLELFCVAGYEQGKTFNLVVRAAEADRGTMERVKELMIDDAQGRKIPLS